MSFGLVALLERQNAFVIKLLHTVVGILGEVCRILCTGGHGLKCGNVFGACAVLCLVRLGARGTECTLRLDLFRLDFRAAYEGDDGVLFDHVTFAEEQVLNAARHLACHEHAACFHLSLQVGVARFRRELLQSDDTKDDQGNQCQDHQNFTDCFQDVHLFSPFLNSICRCGGRICLY